MRLSRSVGVVLPVAAALVVARAAGAQQEPFPTDVRPTRGVAIPAGPIVGDADASALELNPGQLGMVPAASFVLASGFWPDHTVRPARGAGVLLAGPLWPLDALSYGVGLHWVIPSESRSSSQGRTLKLQMGVGLRLAGPLAVGFSWGHIFSNSNPQVDDVDTFDVGFSLRPNKRFGVGLAVHDVNRATLRNREGAGGYRALQRVWIPELAIRPLGDDRLELAGGVRVGGTSGDVSPRGRLSARVRPGLTLFAELDSARIDDEFGLSPTEIDYRAAAGLRFDFDHLSVGLSALGGSERKGISATDEGNGVYGGAVVISVTGERQRPLIDPARVEKIKLGRVDSEREFVSLVVALRRMIDDSGVRGVLLHMDGLDLGLGRTEELRDLVAALRAAGKTVFAYLPSVSMRAYYLASACNWIVVHPAGDVTVAGLSQTVTFYKGALDRLGAAVDLVRIAEFKGAMEPFVRTDHSEPVAQNRNDILDDQFGRMIAAIARNRADRGMTEAKMRDLVDGALFSPDQALAHGLIDAVRPESEMSSHIADVMQRRLPVRDRDSSTLHRSSWGTGRVAVIVVDGDIIDGKSRELPLVGRVVGSDTIVAALDEARRTPLIKAVVLRVNSPGGSAQGSDVMARAIVKLRQAGKPVVVSMGDVAASGGYYIAAPGNAIFAQPSTITGSIGIFTFKADVHALLDKVGVSVETYNRGAHADFFSLYRPWTDQEREMAGDRIRHLYGLFLATIAQGRTDRGLTAERADELGRGRVWTGAQALENKLVDRTGGLGAAIDYAARLADVETGAGGLPEVQVLPPPPATSLASLLVPELGAALPAIAPLSVPISAGTAPFGPEGKSAARLLAPFLLGQGSGTLARMPYDLEIR